MTRYVLDIDDSQWKADHLPRVLRTAESEWLNELACQVEIQITDARPLIVLDLNTTEVEYVVDVLRQPRYSDEVSGSIARIADQIEAQTKPARIPEPGLYGVVEAGGHKWTRLLSQNSFHDWLSDAGGRRGWNALIDPTLIREGVEL